MDINDKVKKIGVNVPKPPVAGKYITPRQKVMASLNGESTDKIPFTVYESKIPQCVTERELRNRGMCIVKRICSYRMYSPNVGKKTIGYKDEQGRELIRTIYSTPYGELSTLDQPAGFTSWHLEHLFKTPDDYKALMFLIKDNVVEPIYDQAAKIANELGEDFIIRDQLPLEPLQKLISDYMGPEMFSYEWMDNRDEILKLYDALVELARRTYPIVADGPLAFANYGGNVIPQVIGADLFRNFYLPHYDEAAAILHKKGKLIGSHLDADNTIIMEDIARSSLDYIEAYDPGMSPSVKEARRIFKDKVLWINWPSAWHIEPLEEVTPKTIGLIEEAAPGNGFIIGITEDVPQERWQQNFLKIMDGIDKCPLKI